MLVIVTRSGGFAGLRRTWSVLVDEQPDAAAWLVLLAELPWDDVLPQPQQPDRFVYLIRYERQSGAPADLVHPHTPAPIDPPEREATLAEQQLQGPWRELVDKVRTADSTTRPDSRRAPDPSMAPDSRAAH
ncbi:protealysin inhibitor emfourin [Leifsonia sp. YIM 134122]|uniref:Protealysin inhibitor emfourin n=1 Tax=Leifsonia stereocauli TaxID=3134136 RepID=A0ABU9W2V9_9MICO